MLYPCLHCKQEVAAELAVRSLIVCPFCEFLFAAEPSGNGEIPTFAEEGSLPRVDGKKAVTAGAVPGDDATIVGDTTDMFGELGLPPGKRLFLEVVETPDSNTERGVFFQINRGRVVIGRSGADVGLEDERVSRKHALIEAISRENIYLKDLASTNGTYLDEQRISMKKLRNGDVLRVGSTSLRFHLRDA